MILGILLFGQHGDVREQFFRVGAKIFWELGGLYKRFCVFFILEEVNSGTSRIPVFKKWKTSLAELTVIRITKLC